MLFCDYETSATQAAKLCGFNSRDGFVLGRAFHDTWFGHETHAGSLVRNSAFNMPGFTVVSTFRVHMPVSYVRFPRPAA